MKLFTLISQHYSALATTDVLAFKLLKRLSIAELMASRRLSYFKIVYNTPLEALFSEHKYSTEQMESLSVFFDAIENLSQLIQSLCAEQWASQSASKIKKISLDSARAILPRCKPHEIDSAVKLYISTSNTEILNQLNNIESSDTLGVIRVVLIRCFPSLPGMRLDELLSQMTNAMDTFRQIQSTPVSSSAPRLADGVVAEFDDASLIDSFEMVESTSNLIRNSLFKAPEIPTQASSNTKTAESCTIS